jgi:GNAT superfamily N-acetyltransferase
MAEDKELKEFLNSLTVEELGQYNILNDDILHNYIYLEKVHKDNKLIAIGGIAKWYRLFPHLFFMVKTEYQSKGIGSQLGDKALEYANIHRLPFMVGAAKYSSPRSLKIIHKLGYRRVWDDGIIYYSVLLLNKRWSFIRILLKAFVPLYCSPLGKPIKYLKEIGRLSWKRTNLK